MGRNDNDLDHIDFGVKTEAIKWSNITELPR